VPVPDVLISENNELIALDFGCMKVIPDSFYVPYFELTDPNNLSNRAYFIDKLYELEILTPQDTEKELAYFEQMFHELLSLFTQPFQAEQFDFSNQTFFSKITDLGETPLPKYIKREVEKSDHDRYQTIYAKEEGAVAAPTAGLHFSRELMKRLELKGVDFAEVTLHIGLGTFRPVEVEDLTKHKMDSEQMIITEKCANIVNEAKLKRKKVFAVGTTSMRAIETSVSTDGLLKPYEGWTNKFIFPPYDFSIADALITNFHTPLSTLLMMISAFCGHDLMMEAYETAIKEKYKFYSYGDAMLIL
jgi:S-adenosylmethionine:tRNA ribosyltransferase-isomerase